MTERRGDTLLFHTSPVIAAQAAVGGKKESEGPLAAGFDELTTDNRLGQCSWEAAEKQLQLRAARRCLQKAALPAERVDLALAGDLQAQCTASGYALRELGVPFAGLFGACSTMAEALALGADCFITGEVRHHEALDALDRGCCIIEAGHFETENPVCEVLADALQKAADALQYNVTVFCLKDDPFGR